MCVRASMKAAKPLHIVLATNPNPTRARGYPLNINPKPDPKPDSISGPAGSGRVADLYHIHTHTFTIVSLLLALMVDLCLPLSAGVDTVELHSVQLELEAVGRQIHELLGKQAQLRKRKATLETSRADAHKSEVSMQRAANTPTTSTPCVSLHRPSAPGT